MLKIILKLNKDLTPLVYENLDLAKFLHINLYQHDDIDTSFSFLLTF